MQCRICDNNDHNKTYTAKEMMLGLRDEHTYFECAECGCLQIAKVPENLPEYYPDENYYSYDDVKKASGIKGSLIKHRDRYAATGKGLIGKWMHRIQPHDKLPSIAQAHVSLDSRILDVGCGAGHLLHSMKDAGFSNLLGIDPFNAKDIAHDNGLRVEKKSIHDMSGESHWDLIMYNHSYEHVFDQMEVLEKTFSLLKPGGTCMLRIPTVTSWAWRTFGVDWVQLDAPRHLFLHSVRSVHILAEKAGFKLEDVIYDSFAFQYWGSQQYQKDITLLDPKSYAVNPEKSQYSTEQIKEFEAHSKQLNEEKAGDQAAFYLKKPV